MPEQYTNEEMVRLYKAAKEKGNTELAGEILWRIVEQNMSMVYDRIYAFSLERSNINKEDKEDMAQESMIALMRAVETYDERCARFSTWAYSHVEHSIQDWIYKNFLISIPRQKQKYIYQYYKIIDDFKRINKDRIPSDEYIKQNLHVDDETYRDIKAAIAASKIKSLDEEVELGEDNFKLENTISIEKDSFIEEMISNNKEQFLDVLINLRRKCERQVLIDHFYNDMDFAEIAKKRGVTKQRIKAIRKKAYENLSAMPEVQSMAIEFGINIYNKPENKSQVR